MDRENSEVKMEMQRKERLNEKGLTAYFDQMATDGRVETTVQWLVEVSLLIQSDVEKRLKHAHAPLKRSAHRAVGNQEQDADNGKLAGYCLVCQIPWPCEYAGQPLGNTTAIRKAAEDLTDAIENSKRTINHRTQVTDVYFEMESALTALNAALEVQL